MNCSIYARAKNYQHLKYNGFEFIIKTEQQTEEGLNGVVAFTVNGQKFGFFTANG